MKIFYKEIRREGQKRYQVLRSEPCCEKMDVLFEDSVVGFGTVGAYDEAAPVVALGNTESNYDSVDTEYIQINYCPWCGHDIKCHCEQVVQVMIEEWEETETVKRSREREVPVVTPKTESS